MQKIGFAEALEIIIAEDPRYDREAYIFLRDALDFTIKQLKKSKEDVSRHVSPPQLLDGVRQYAIKEFGPMVPTVFSYWGVQNCGDIGEMVFNLIRIGIFGKTETDTIDQFRNYYDFEEAFVVPFRPQNPLPGVKTGPEQTAHQLE
ncbi:MAG: Minf_1886 family protein [Verrucomicrobiota bacterium]